MLKCDIIALYHERFFLMKNLFQNIKNAHTGIQTNDFGEEWCAPGHSYGPKIRDYWLIHFIVEGKGKFFIGGNEYSLGSHELFLIPPGIMTFYKADYVDPWHYMWIGLQGIEVQPFLASAGLTKESPIMKFSDELLQSVLDIGMESNRTGLDSPRSIGYVYFFIDELQKCGSGKKNYVSNAQSYVEKALSIIHKSIYDKISVAEIANEIGIDRSYLCNIFKKYTGCSPINYISEKKIEIAKDFLTSTSYDIKSISSSLGYENQFVFSHAFRNKTGMSPREWRQKDIK